MFWMSLLIIIIILGRGLLLSKHSHDSQILKDLLIEEQTQIWSRRGYNWCCQEMTSINYRQPRQNSTLCLIRSKGKSNALVDRNSERLKTNSFLCAKQMDLDPHNLPSSSRWVFQEHKKRLSSLMNSKSNPVNSNKSLTKRKTLTFVRKSCQQNSQLSEFKKVKRLKKKVFSIC